ncbi:MAG: AsmA family protein [Deltaproteobacteria bacterium]|nr:MAG: AsmA family protein [Deltaproteobacteria bacterium]
MKKVIRLVLLVTATLIMLCFLALLIIPRFIDVQKYKPVIEEKVSEATGRPFTLGGDLRLSLFPWAGLALSDLRLGAPPGFKEKDFISVESFEFQVKLLPLLSKDIQVKRFVLAGPRIVLEKSKDGRANWEGLGKGRTEAPAEPEAKDKVPQDKRKEGLPIESLVVGTFTIKDGNLLWIDHTRGQRRELKDLNLRLDEISLEKPIRLSVSALVEDRPFSVEGKLGPIGKKPGEGSLSLDFSARVFDTVNLKAQGQVTDASTRPSYALNFQIEPFSPRKLATAFGEPLPLTPADPDALKRLALKVSIQGNAQALTLKDGALELDDSKLKFFANLKEFSKPNATFDLKLDQIDLDRYLPASQDKPGETKAAAPPTKKTDYTSLRTLVLDGRVHIDKVKVKNVQIQDLDLKIRGRGGVMKVDPFTMRLYDGSVTSKGNLDVRRNTPASNVTFQMNGVAVRPLLKDLMEKDFLEGTMRAQVALAMTGDSAEKIKPTLNGKGEFHFNDGAIVGIDLAEMVRNVQSAFGKEKGSEKPRTDFAELRAPFTLTNGVFNTPNTTLLNPFLRVLAKGKADLVRETLDFRVKPKFVATLEGQGAKTAQSGVAVPVLVTGTFSSPQFRPDLESIIKGRLEKELPDASGLKKALEDPQKRQDDSTSVEEKAKSLLKGLPFGK